MPQVAPNWGCLFSYLKTFTMRLNDHQFYKALVNDPPTESESAKEYYQRQADKHKLSWKYIKKRLHSIAKKNQYTPGVEGLRIASENAAEQSLIEKASTWREIMGVVEQHQQLKKKLSKSDYEPVAVIETDQPIILVFLSDLHIGSSATDYTLFQQITNDLLEVPNLYAILGGDEVDFAIKLRGVSEVFGNVIDPETQLTFLQSWFDEVQHKIIAAMAGNHDAWRTERATGLNPFMDIFSKKIPYSKGICRLDLTVGDQDYKLALSHTFKGNSMYNAVHSLKRNAREENPDCDVFFAGHNHKPGIGQDWESGKHRCYINSGSIQINSSYAKRFHSLRSMPVYPCVVLWPDQHKKEVFSSVHSYLQLSNQKGGISELSR